MELFAFLYERRFLPFILFSYDYSRCFPLISCIFLKSFQKKLDFRLKVIGGEISAIPGISDALEVWQNIKFSSRKLGCCVFYSLGDGCNYPLYRTL